MNERENDDHDRELHDAQLSALYRQLPQAEPAADLDAAIRAAARRAVHAGPGNRNIAAARQQRHLGWFATAAVALLCVGLVVQMERQSPEPLPAAMTPAPAAKPQPANELAAAAPAPAEAPARTTVPAEKKSANSNQPAEAARARARADAFDKYGQEAPAGNLAQADSDRMMAPVPPPTPAAAPAPIIAAPEPAPAAVAVAKPAPQSRAIIAPKAEERAIHADSASETAARRLDRDIERQLQTPAAPPACANHDNGDQQPLCDLLILHAAGQPLPTDWQQRLDAAGLWQGDFAYRRVLLERLFAR
ncbi:MAG: hypothetical protein FWC58_10975 [Desulfobulbus sp.]|nr:hypothetical protein [Desulfobulbus sp.]